MKETVCQPSLLFEASKSMTWLPNTLELYIYHLSYNARTLRGSYRTRYST